MKSRKGFTLVELLIVIVVIGILSAMMMMSSNEAVTTARANNIASNLRNLKVAALAYYTDHINEADRLANGKYQAATDNVKKAIFGYLNGETHIPESNDYFIEVKNGKWYVTYEGMKSGSKMVGINKIKEKLKGRKNMGFLKGDYSAGYNGDNEIALRIR